jgi:pimeloyl-ACP methyl ester carboxylesterase
MAKTSVRCSLDRGGRAVGYRVCGDGKTVVVLQHGWMTDGRLWDELLEHLDTAVGSGVRYVVPDLAGHGASAAPAAYVLADLADDLLAIARHEAKSDRFVLVGHSMAGQVATLAAAAAGPSVKGLALFTPVPVSGLPLPADAAGLFATSGEDRGKQATILGLACTSLGEPEKEFLLDVAGAIPKATIAALFEAWSQGHAEAKAGEVLASIDIPTLVLATDDPFLPPPFLRAAYVEKLSRGRLVMLPGAGHYPQVERPRETAAVLGAFLAGLA